ncbi:ParB/Srx family N-terminal domain-containing protein [Microbacterium sp. NPDC019599]|uniref:ParB/Srx family N-terminal domain-containing protein n=1 Tax=Microbacterium sp. NPDC019599 TaxID=3154690 RepID=UPI0033F70142
MRPIGNIPLEELLLDVDNPRLPRGLSDLSQESVLEHLYRRAALQELAESIYSNGFFSSEPVIVSEPDGNGRRTVLEGNRRLATALILAGDSRATTRGLGFRIDGAPAQKHIGALPAVEVDDEQEFETYLGFRHISGLRMWGAGEKARYLWSRVKAATSSDEIFYRIGRQVGSNARGVRSAYIAYELLEHARREGAAPDLVDYVISERFGVWTRLLGTKNLSTFISLDASQTELDGVDTAIAQIELTRLTEVLEDLRPAAGRREATLRDSRQVTDYSDAIGDEIALGVLRSSGNLDLASTIANRPDLGRVDQGVLVGPG